VLGDYGLMRAGGVERVFRVARNLRIPAGERADEDDGEGIAGTDDGWRAGLPSAVVAVLRGIDGPARVREL